MEDDKGKPAAPGDDLSHRSPEGPDVGEWEREHSRLSPEPDDLDSRAVKVLTSYYSGPYPPPSMLREYEAIVPGLAKEIAEGVRSQTQHRQRLETAVVLGSLGHEKLGVIIGGVIGLASTIMGGIVALYGFPIAGGSIATVCVVSLTGIFVYGTDSRRKEREKKAQIQQRIAGEAPPQLDDPVVPTSPDLLHGHPGN